MFARRQEQQKKAEDCYQKAKLILEGDITTFEGDLESILQTAAVLKHAEAMLMLGILLIENYYDDKSYHRAFKYFNSAHEQGLLIAKFYLAVCHREGTGTDQNTELAIKLFEDFVRTVKALQASKNSNSKLDKLLMKAVANLAQEYLAKQDKSSADKAYTLLSLAEQYGDLNAAHNLAIIMLHKSLKENDSEKKSKLQKIWFKRLSTLAEKHYTEAEYDLAVAYRFGKAGVQIDLKQAEDLFWRAALGGKYESFYHLFHLYEDLNDQTKAFEAVSTGAALGNKLCRKEYGFKIFTTPSATLLQVSLALNYLLEAASNGDTEIMTRCAHLYLVLYNHDPAADNAAAILEQVIIIYRTAANFHHQSKYDLARVLMDHPGSEVKQSYDEAEKNLRQLLVNNDVSLVTKAQDLLTTLLQKQSVLPVVTKEIKKNNKPQNKTAPLKIISPTPLIKFLRDEKTEPVIVETKPDALVIPPVNVPEEKKYEPMPVRNINSYSSSARINFPLPEDVYQCLRELERQGYSSYLTGGLLRNLLLGIAIDKDDADIISVAPIEKLESTFRQQRHLYMQDLCRFKTNNRFYDVKSDPKLDLLVNASQRDFTINALFINAAGEIFDPTARGLVDLYDTYNQLKTILPEDVCFSTDHFRILRLLYFMGAGFSSQISVGACMHYLQILRQDFDLFHNTIQNHKAIDYTKKTELFTKFDNYICKFFMSGKSAFILEKLFESNFFAIMFPGIQFDAGTIAWLRWRTHINDEVINQSPNENVVSKKTIYAIIIAAMLTTPVESTEEMTYLLKTYPFPNTLQWKLSLIEVQIWARERQMYCVLDQSYNEALALATRYQLEQQAQQSPQFWPHQEALGQSYYPYFNYFQPVALAPTMYPTDFSPSLNALRISH